MLTVGTLWAYIYGERYLVGLTYLVGLVLQRGVDSPVYPSIEDAIVNKLDDFLPFQKSMYATLV